MYFAIFNSLNYVVFRSETATHTTKFSNELCIFPYMYKKRQ